MLALVLFGLIVLSFALSTFFVLLFFMIYQYTGGWNIFCEPVFWMIDVPFTMGVFLLLLGKLSGEFN
jgi:hypothetical protein